VGRGAVTAQLPPFPTCPVRSSRLEVPDEPIGARARGFQDIPAPFSRGFDNRPQHAEVFGRGCGWRAISFAALSRARPIAAIGSRAWVLAPRQTCHQRRNPGDGAAAMRPTDDAGGTVVGANAASARRLGACKVAGDLGPVAERGRPWWSAMRRPWNGAARETIRTPRGAPCARPPRVRDRLADRRLRHARPPWGRRRLADDHPDRHWPMMCALASWNVDTSAACPAARPSTQ